MVLQRYMRSRFVIKLSKLLRQDISSNYCRYCSSLAAQENHEYSYKIASDNPTDHSYDDVGKFYKADEKSLGPLSISLGKKFIKMTKAIQQSDLLIRKPSLDIVSSLNKQSESDEPPRFIIYGPDGSGKTFTMLHVLHRCMMNDWLLVYAPRGEKFADSKSKTPVVQSTWNTSRFDHPEVAIQWLQFFGLLNKNKLSQMKTSQDYVWGKRDKTEKGKPLLDVLEQGMSRSVFSTDAVGVLLKEIHLSHSVNVLYAIDGFNGFYGHTRYKHDEKPINVENLSLVHHFSKLLKQDHGIKRGAYLLGLSRSIANPAPQSDPMFIESLLPAQAFQLIGPHERILVPNFDENEVLAMLNYYKANNWLTRDLSRDFINQLKFLTNKNPKAIRNICSAL